ncbi:nucleotide excision repair endonuclease [Flavobacterium sp. HJJ]|uniref:nucleotide excision repair endonuclease n=1 Tax=Flavobacterium sp. HJJ TaxID=2783792 RepID=UPI00293B8740|nr:nucleotide excision repair endonuclease [Flavobacterium sp. HJJ]
MSPEDFELLPEKTGVYYFYNEQKKVIYIGKAVNLKKRMTSHFTGHKITPQRQNFLRDIYSISFEVCVTELMALLLECVEIKKLWPIYNRALKRFEPKYGLYQYETRNGYRYLTIGKISKAQICIEVFNSEYEAINVLRSLMQHFEIDYRFCKFSRSVEGQIFINKELSNLPEVELHNEQIENAIFFC